MIEQVEKMTSEQAREIQLENLRKSLALAIEKSPFYRKLYRQAGLEPGDIRSLDQLDRLPSINRKTVGQNFRQMTCAPREEWIDLCPTSGTSGRSVYFPMTLPDLDLFAKLGARGARGLGIDRTDTVQVTLTGDNLLQPTRVMTETFQRYVQCLTLRAGPVGHQRQVKIMNDYPPTVLFGIPQYLLSLGRSLNDLGFNPKKQLNLKLLISTGATVRHRRWAPTALQKEVEQIWGAPYYSILGSTELNTGLWECPAHNGHHIPWDYYIVRVVDPQTGRPLPPGQVGELELTLTGRQAMPLIRYRTGDVTSIETDPCPCGRTSPRVMAIRGRLDQLIKVKGQSVFPQQIEEGVLSVEGVSVHLIEVLNDNTGQDQIHVTVDRPEQEIHRQVVRQVKDATNLTVIADFACREEIEKTWFCEGRVKPRKFWDRRRREI